MSPAAVVQPSFTEERIERLIQMERSHFWFEGRRRVILRLLSRYVGAPPKTLLDLGSGGGYFCETLHDAGYRMTAADFLPGGLRRLSVSAPGVRVLQCTAENLSLRNGQFDAALVLDVLEHVDDRSAVQQLRDVLRPGGVLLLTVPAMPWLWSFRDEAAGHKRRYTRSTLQALLSSADLNTEFMGYYQFFLFPLTILSRYMGRNSSTVRDFEDLPPRPLNAALTFINRAEAFLSRWCRWPWGSSLVAVARRSHS